MTKRLEHFTSIERTKNLTDQESSPRIRKVTDLCKNGRHDHTHTLEGEFTVQIDFERYGSDTTECTNLILQSDWSSSFKWYTYLHMSWRSARCAMCNVAVSYILSLQKEYTWCPHSLKLRRYFCVVTYREELISDLPMIWSFNEVQSLTYDQLASINISVWERIISYVRLRNGSTTPSSANLENKFLKAYVCLRAWISPIKSITPILSRTSVTMWIYYFLMDEIYFR